MQSRAQQVPLSQPCPLGSSHSVLTSDRLRQGRELVTGCLAQQNLRFEEAFVLGVCVRRSASVWMAVCHPHLHLDKTVRSRLAVRTG